MDNEKIVNAEFSEEELHERMVKQQAARLEMCGKEISEVLNRYRCRMVAKTTIVESEIKSEVIILPA